VADRTLIFFSSLGPDNDDSSWRPFRYAVMAAEAGASVEIQLVGPATGLMRGDARGRLTGRMKDAFEQILALDVPIWLTPGCAEHRGVTDVDLKETGAQPRELGAMFGEVAAGAQLVPCDW